MLQRIRAVLTSCFAVCIVVSLLSVQTGHAQVIDKKTRKVFGGLRREDFEIYEENVRQPIVYFSQDQLPLSVLLLLDISRSVTPIIEQVGAGANEALQRLKPEDEVAVMAFADNPKLFQR